MQKKLIILAIAVLGIVLSCTKLDVKPYSVILASDYKPTAGDIGPKYVGPMYLLLHAVTGSNQSGSLGDCFQEQSFCTDEAITPTRGGDWYDGGHFQDLFKHRWTPITPDFNTIWKFGFDLVILSNQNIHFIQRDFPANPAETRPYIEELRGLRSIGYYYLLDFFGNVPVTTKYDSLFTPIGNAPTLAEGRTQLFDTLINDVTAGLPYLSAGHDKYTFGAYNKWTAYSLLAKLYINSEVWTGVARWDDCIAACDSVINAPVHFALAGNYFNNFKQANQDSKENIFVVPYSSSSSEYTEGFYYMSMHYNSSAKYNTLGAPWNGFCCLPDHYHAFDSTDIRRNSWSAGPQFAADGTTPLLMIRPPYAGKQLNFTPDFIDVSWNVAPTVARPAFGDTLNFAVALENNGARLQKYEIPVGLQNTCLGVPLPLFRLADIMLLKAEAMMRKNGGVATQDAVDIVNKIRARANVSAYTTSTLTMDELLAERGRELTYEGVRRQDLIRWGKFIKGTWGRNYSGTYQDIWNDRSWETEDQNVFPIPQIQKNGNPLLNQNHGY
jgi:starch-binding outer membrane protein, SusD/RagB family